MKVLNFGVPGYGLEELARQLAVKHEIYSVRHVVYLLNPNDFARRNSVYEGADDGLYRMYHPPDFVAPWFLRKLWYRAYRMGSVFSPTLASLGWYQWLYRNNRSQGLAHLEAMRAFCDSKGIAFTLVLLPVRSAFTHEGFGLSGMFQDIAAFASARGIDTLDASRAFAAEPEKLLEETEHFTLDGNRRLAALLAERLSLVRRGKLSLQRKFSSKKLSGSRG